MRQRRHNLQVSTFPFLAVLLCAMGSLILLLLVIDRRAKVVARARILRAAMQAQTEDTEAIAQAAAERKAELERRRQALHALLTQQDQDLLAQVKTVEQQVEQASSSFQAEQVRGQALQGKFKEESGRLSQKEAELAGRRAHLADTKTRSETVRTELVQMTEELELLERMLLELKALRQRDQRTYSVVPYKGKQGDNRKPLYVECAGTGLIFHPDRLTMAGVNLTPGDIRIEVERRLARQKAKASDDGKPLPDPYLLMLVRPDGIPSFYHLEEALEGLKVDFGYELIDRDWVLDFPETGESTRTQPWMAAKRPETSPAPSGSFQEPVVGRPRGLMHTVGEINEGVHGGGATGPAAGKSSGPMMTSASAGHSGPDLTPSSGGISGNNMGGHPPGDGSTNSAGGLGQAGPGMPLPNLGTSRHSLASLTPDPLAGKQGSGGGKASVAGGLPDEGNGSPPLSAADRSGERGSPSGNLSGSANDGIPSADPQGQHGGPDPHSTQGPDAAIPTGADGQVGAAGHSGDTAGLGTASPQGPGGAAPVFSPKMSASVVGQGTGQHPNSGSTEPQAAPPQGVPPATSEPGESHVPDENGPTSPFLGSPESNTRPRQAGPVRPGLPHVSRDWIIPVECTADSVVIYSLGMRIPLERINQGDGAEDLLLQTVRQFIDRRQATVYPGQPLYHPIIRFLVRSNGQRSYYVAYPSLDQLHVTMTRQNLEVDEAITPDMLR